MFLKRSSKAIGFCGKEDTLMNGKPETDGTKGPEKKGWFGSVMDGVKQKGQDLTELAQDTRGSFDLISKVKNFASSAAEIAKSIDEDLRAKGSAYEIGYYRVMGNLSVMGGLTLDIHFTKTAFAKEDAMFLVVIDPKTGQALRVPRKAIAGREQAQIRHPETGEVLLIDTRSGKILLE